MNEKNEKKDNVVAGQKIADKPRAPVKSNHQKLPDKSKKARKS